MIGGILDRIADWDYQRRKRKLPEHFMRRWHEVHDEWEAEAKRGIEPFTRYMNGEITDIEAQQQVALHRQRMTIIERRMDLLVAERRDLMGL